MPGHQALGKILPASHPLEKTLTMIDHLIHTPARAAARNQEDEELVGAGFAIVLAVILVASAVIAFGLWSQALALGIGVWLGKRH